MQKVKLFVPGRLCILGEHTDWAGGYRTSNSSVAIGKTLVCTTNEGLYGEASCLPVCCFRFEHSPPDEFRPLPTHKIKEEADELPLVSGRAMEWELCYETLLDSAKSGGFFSYVAGTAAVILRHKKWNHDRCNKSNGIFINNYRSTLPMKKGLSSSAAICVLTCLSFDRIYSLDFTKEEIMEIAYQGEMLTPSKCGRMDQCVVMGENSVGFMQFDGLCSLQSLGSFHCCSLDILNLPKGFKIYFVVVDLKSEKDTIKILHDLNSCFPYPCNPNQVLMHKYCDEISANIAPAAVRAITEGNLVGLAEQMQQAQSVFDLYVSPNCPQELKSPKLHKLMEDPTLRSQCLAIKGVGSQGDGTAQILCENSLLQNEVLQYIRDSLQLDGFLLTISTNK